MSYKALNVSKDIYKEYKNNHKLDILKLSLTIMLFISLIVNIINFYTGNHRIVIYIIFFILTLLSAIGIYRNEKINKDSKIEDHKFIEKIFEVFKKHNITTEKQLLILKEEIEKELSEKNKLLESQKKICGKLFLYIFWIPIGFLIAYYFNSSDEKLHYDVLMEIIFGLLTVFLQILGIYIMLFSAINPIFNIIVFERNRYYKTLDYIYEYHYHIKK